MDWIKQNWFKITLLVIVIALGYFFIQKDNSKYSALEYKELNEECKNFSTENWDSELDYNQENSYTMRHYEFSIPLETCVMKATHRLTKEDGSQQTMVELRDIYLDKEIIFFNSECIANHDYGEGMSNEELDELCPPRSKVFDIEKEIWKK